MTHSLTGAVAVALALTVAGSAAYASNDKIRLNEQQQTELRTKLQADGYEVRRIDSEDGLIEVYALKDGKKIELYLDPQYNIVRTKSDD